MWSQDNVEHNIIQLIPNNLNFSISAHSQLNIPTITHFLYINECRSLLHSQNHSVSGRDRLERTASHSSHKSDSQWSSVTHKSISSLSHPPSVTQICNYTPHTSDLDLSSWRVQTKGWKTHNVTIWSISTELLPPCPNSIMWSFDLLYITLTQWWYCVWTWPEDEI